MIGTRSEGETGGKRERKRERGKRINKRPHRAGSLNCNECNKENAEFASNEKVNSSCMLDIRSVLDDLLPAARE